MSAERPRTTSLPANREEWRTKRDARQQLLAKVRARRWLALQRKQAVPQTGD